MNAMIRPRNPCLAALLLAAVASAASAQVPSIWREQQLEAMDKSDAIMQRAHDQKGLLAQYQVMRRAYAADGKPAFRAIFGQYLSWYQSFLGDYRDAELAFSIQQKPLADDNPSPLAQPGWHHLRALDYIPQLAKQYRVVFLNEAHNIALTRTLTVRLLKPLREEGFNVFAVETLYQPDMAAMKERGYPIAKSGFYTREPIYAEMVRTALKLGYKVVAYEADPDRTGDAREVQQAKHLWKILKDDPHAKLVVNAGYGHIQKTGQFLGAQSMAEHFVKDSGINPLSVEQTILIPHLDGSMNHPDYDAIIGAVHPDRPIVFVDKDGKPWSLRPGYDVSVIFPEEHFVNGRPTWAGLWGARVPYTVNGTVCQDHWPCMVAAFYADEGEDAIPADRMVLDPVPLMTIDDIKITSGNYSIPTGQLYLRPDQRYRLVISSERGQRIGSQTITVKSSDKSLTSAPPDSPRAAICSVAAVGQAAIQPVPCQNR
ncbi:MAG: hypothetical protein J0H27_11165 [Xanthomonadales bacterium]|nr:hypothetical protein [Xanthomonadales bacterium]ODU93507.1 MAG: hypothetical protein ABT18_07305 [Rhodanobacter sp. SCN 66-43]OJY86603.1 MAG: hypothetical protein BGP23_03165 [Xanthomonadales bacterium 66-474]